jgi:hypothetical protein
VLCSAVAQGKAMISSNIAANAADPILFGIAPRAPLRCRSCDISIPPYDQGKFVSVYGAMAAQSAL